MAFAEGRSSQSVRVERFIGVGVVKVLKPNPNKKGIEGLFGITLQEEPEYIGKKEIDGNQVPSIRIDFPIQTIPEENNGINTTTRIQFFLTKAYQYNKERTKVKMINKYGEVAWIPCEDARLNKVPDNISWFSSKGMRPALRGEEELTSFLKEYLAIPRRTYKDPNTGVSKEIVDVSKAEAQLENMDKLFQNNMSEINAILSAQPDNKIKVAFGVRTTSDNKQYQDVLNTKVLRYNSNATDLLEREVNNRKMNSGYKDTIFSFGQLEEFKNEPTDFSSAPDVSTIEPPTNNIGFGEEELPKSWFEAPQL